MARRGGTPKLVSKSTVTFAVGLGLAINEALFRTGDRPYLIVLIGLMLGLPVADLADKFRGRGKDSDE